MSRPYRCTGCGLPWYEGINKDCPHAHNAAYDRRAPPCFPDILPDPEPRPTTADILPDPEPRPTAEKWPRSLLTAFVRGFKRGAERSPTFWVVFGILWTVNHYLGFEWAVLVGLAGIAADVNSLEK